MYNSDRHPARRPSAFKNILFSLLDEGLDVSRNGGVDGVSMGLSCSMRDHRIIL
jgi:hypothetical protein